VFSDDILNKAQALISASAAAGVKIATVESCTGGLIGGCLVSIAGSSAVFERGFLTYSNEAKIDMVGVPPATIDAHGAVSRETAIAMAEGGLACAPVDMAVAVTGIAGPAGGTAEKPVGMVAISVARKGQDTICEVPIFDGDRTEIRLATVEYALDMMLKVLH